MHDNNSAALVGQMFDKISSTLSAALQSQHIELDCYFKLSCCSSVVLMIAEHPRDHRTARYHSSHPALSFPALFSLILSCPVFYTVLSSPVLSYSHFSHPSPSISFLCAEENPDEEHGRDRDVCEVIYEEVIKRIKLSLFFYFCCFLVEDIAVQLRKRLNSCSVSKTHYLLM